MNLVGSEKNGIATISLTRATLILAVFTLLSRLVGWIRNLILASTFGAGSLLDAYYTAFRIPDFLFNFFIIGTLTVAFLPIFNRELIKNQKSAEKLASSIYTISVTGMAVLSAVFFFLTPALMNIIAPGFEGEQRELAILLTRILLISPVIFTASTISAVILQSYHRFLPTAIAPILYNFGIIFGAAVLYRLWGPVGLVLGVLIGALLHLVMNSWPLFKLPIKLRPALNFKLASLKEIWRLYVPRLFAFEQMQISLLSGSIIGSLLATGSITVFNLAQDLQAAPLGVFALSFAVAAFPSLSRSWAGGAYDEFKRMIVQTSIQILFFIIPLSAFIFILRAQIVRLLLGRGQFGWEETILTAQTLGVLILSLFAQSLTPLLSRAFYATQNTIVPVVVSIVTAVVNIVLAIFFSRQWGVVGLGVATSIAAVVGFLLLVTLLRFRVGLIDGLAITERILKILIATSVAATAAYAVLYAVDPVLNTRTTLGLFLQTATATIFGMAVYIIVGLLLNLREARSFVYTIKLWLLKLTRPVSILVSPWFD